jgi:riboflavin kinase/FMN adenylyltransferase
MQILGETDSLSGACSALALGFFDGVHKGHQAVIGAAVAHGVHGLLPTVFTFGVTGAAPAAKTSAGLLQTPQLKAEALSELGVRCLYQPEFSAIQGMDAADFVHTVILGRLKARMVACGADFRFGRGAGGDVGLLRRMLTEAGVALEVVPQVLWQDAPISSTRIRAAVAAGQMEQAAQMLGRPFAIDFVVEHGQKLGSSIGLPTANQRFDSQIVRPRFGVYAARVSFDGKSYAAAANVGIKPTVGSDGVLCESYIKDFSGNIYGRRIKTELLHFLRPEQKFESVEALRDAIRRDADRAFDLVKG